MFHSIKRFLRMSLSTWFLIFAILCALAFAYARFIRPSHVEANAIRGLEDLGINVTVYYEHEFEDRPSCSVPVPPGPAWVKAIFGEMVLARISSVELEGEIKTLADCHDLLSQLTNLKSLSVNSTVLESVDALKHLDGLESISFERANSLKNIDALSNMNLSHVTIFNCNGLASLDSLGKIKSLDRLFIQECSGLRELSLADWKTVNLEHLYFGACDRLATVHGFPQTRKGCSFELSFCKTLEKITLQKKSNLDEFFVSGCDKLDSIGVLPESLTGLKIRYCKSLGKVEGQKIPSLKQIEIFGLPESVSFDFSLESAERFELKDCNGIKDLDLSQPIQKLKHLQIERCKKLVSLDNLPASVENVSLIDCESLERVKQKGLSNPLLQFEPSNVLPNLKRFYVWNCPNLSEIPEKAVVKP